MQLKSGTSLQNGRFTIKSCIGDGGFGITYLANDERLGREVVLKEYFPDHMVKRDTTVSTQVHTLDVKYDDEFHTGITKFLKEAKTLAQFNNIPGVADVYDFFPENDTAYIVMEYIKGQNLKALIKSRTTPFSFREALNTLSPCMFALQKVHESGIIHRDFAPDNILIDEKGRLKIIDFGSSRDYVENNATMTVMVKHGYAPPEQYTNAVKQGPYTDVYSLGAIFYEMLTLKKPSPSVDRIFSDSLAATNTINTSVTPAQNEVVMKALSVSYETRYQSIDEFSKALRLVADNPNTAFANSAQAQNAQFSAQQYNANIAQATPAPSANYGNGYAQANPSPINTKSKKGLIIGIIAAVAVIALVGIIWATSGSSSSSSKKSSSKKSSSESKLEKVVGSSGMKNLVSDLNQGLQTGGYSNFYITVKANNSSEITLTYNLYTAIDTSDYNLTKSEIADAIEDAVHDQYMSDGQALVDYINGEGVSVSTVYVRLLNADGSELFNRTVSVD